MTTILDGKTLSDDILRNSKKIIDMMTLKPHLAVIQVGNNIASQIYVKKKQKTAETIGLKSTVINLKKDISEKELIDEIQALNENPEIHAILVQLPLPKHIDEFTVLESIDYLKDVDGFSNYNIANISKGKPPIVYPCTPKGIMTLFDKYNIEIAGKHAVVIGRSNIVGRPMAAMLLNKDATVTICHSKTKNLAEITRNADIIVSAAGIHNLVTADMVKEGSVVADVGINRLDSGRIVGDVDYVNVREVAGFITPVPGGVGPMTIAMLMDNTIELFKYSFVTNKS